MTSSALINNKVSARPAAAFAGRSGLLIGLAMLAIPMAAIGQTPSSGVRPVKAVPATPVVPPGIVAPDSTALALGCVIEPAQTAEVAAGASGVLESVLVDRGAVVRRGQVLATLQSDVEKAAYEAARSRAASESEVNALDAARDLAKTKLKRMHALSQLDYGGRLELETAAAEFEIADHRLQQAREALLVARRDEELARQQLEQRSIRSPIDGVVADRLLHPGERVDGRPILRVLSVSRLRAEVVVPASRFGQITPGMPARVAAEGAAAPEVVARVAQVDRFVDAASGTFRARLSLSDPGGRLPPGVRCRVAFGGGGEFGPPAAAGTGVDAAAPIAKPSPPARVRPTPASPTLPPGRT